MILLFVLLLAGTASALPDNDPITAHDPPPRAVGERVPVFLVLNEQPQHLKSFAELKADALGRQAQVLQNVRATDPVAFRTARSYWIANAVWLEADPATLDRLASIPGVDHIEPDLTVMLNDPVVEVSSTISPDFIVRLEDSYSTVWSADFIEAPSVWKGGNTGEGVTIAIIDTGIDSSHPAFGDRIIAFADFVNGDNSSAYDDHGHGTHCAGTAAGGTVTVEDYRNRYEVTLGVAPGADLIGAKVLNSAGSGPFSTILEGAQWAIDNGADVVSMSLGAYVSRSTSDPYFSLAEGESRIVELEVSSEMYGDSDCRYEPQFVIGSVRVEDWYYDTADLFENLTITVTDAQGNAANGAEIDWLGFDSETNCYYFKAPYASNTAGWNGFWELNVTNTGATEIRVEEIGLSECYQSGGETVLDTTINNMVRGGTVVTVSAGNDGFFGTSTIGTPGTAKDAITVGATDYMMDYRASFSSMGPVNRTSPYIKPDVMAPGVGIISAYPGDQYASMQGTSMSCPAVAGTAALMLSGNSTLKPADVKAALMETAVHIGEDGTILPVMQPNNAYGAGRINAYEAVNVTGGLGGMKPSDGILRELIGGTLTQFTVTGNVLPIMAVLWNTTAGEPMAGEEVNVSVWYYACYTYERTPVFDQTIRTDADGYIYCPVDITDIRNGTPMWVQITYGDLRVEDQVTKDTISSGQTPNPSPNVPIFESEDYSVPYSATVPIKYPLLAADGSPYTEVVTFTVENYSKTIVEEVLVPVDGVIGYSLNLTGRPLDETDLYLWINDRSAGSISVGEEPHIFQEVMPLPERAICPPGMSVNLGLMAWSHHGQKTVSQDFDVYVTTLTETEILSLSPAGALTLSTDQGDMQALLAEIAGMKPVTRTGTVRLTNGIGLLNFTMPENGYMAIVQFVSPNNAMAQYSGEATTVLVYGTLEPWLMHRSTPPVHEDLYSGNLTYIGSYSDWPATWDQDAYASVPSDRATITAYIYNYDPILGIESFIPGQTVYLYTENGVQTSVTDADGYCTFTVDTAGKTRMDYILTTAGISGYGTTWIGGTPFSPNNFCPVRPGLISSELFAPTSIGALSPNTEMYIVDAVPDGDACKITARSYGPDGTPIHEKGFFVFNRQSAANIWNIEATEAAAVVEFTGTETRLVTPAANGTYEVRYGLLNPTSKNIGKNLYTAFRNPEKSVSYKMPDSVLVGTSVPIAFNVSTSDGAPIVSARVVIAAGAAGEPGRSWFNGDPRDTNILLASDWYPDPYTVIATGYTDASGKVTLTVTAPTAGQQALRESLAHASDIPYLVLCYHDGELVWEHGGNMMVTSKLLPDFVPGISAPQIVKLERDDSITLTNVALNIKNIGTADYVYAGARMNCTAEVGSRHEDTRFEESLEKGETKTVVRTTITRKAREFGINTSDYRLPLDVSVGIEVNSNRAVEELNYANNLLTHPVRITAPDLAVEIVAPRYTSPANETVVGIRVTNRGEVGSNVARLEYSITGVGDASSDVPALGAKESVTIWANRTFAPGEYKVDAEVNKNGVTDYETTFDNNRANATIGSYINPPTRIELPGGLILVPGTTYDLPITVMQVSDLAAYKMDLTFNGSILAVESVIPGPLGAVANSTSGRVIFAGQKVDGVSGDVTVATIRFLVTGKTGDETPLNLVVEELLDVRILPIPVDVRSGSASLLLYGDANGDGKVNQADTLKVLRQVVGLEQKPKEKTKEFLVTDVTRNGVIDVGDAMFIAQKNVDLRDAYFRIK